jgi:hypothetical protein
MAAAGSDTAQSPRRASFALRQPPYTVAAQVEFPQPPDTARMWMRVALDPIPIAARVVCSAPDRNGIRSASAVASSPLWVNVRLDRLEQSPELCGAAGVGWFVGTGLVIGS